MDEIGEIQDQINKKKQWEINITKEFVRNIDAKQRKLVVNKYK